MNNVDFLEHGGRSAFLMIVNGEQVELPDPRDRHYQWVLACLSLRHVPGTPGDIPEWKRLLAFERWRAMYELPDFRNAQRLAYLVDHFRSPMTYDLQVYANADLGELWRGRRWLLLLDILDHLPAHSWFSSTVSMDEEHARLMAEALRAQPESERTSNGPPLHTWTPEVAVLNNVFDAIRRLEHTMIALKAGDKAPKAPDPAPRPITPLERAMKRVEYERRQEKHERLAARLLRR